MAKKIEIVRGTTQTFAILLVDGDDEPYTLKDGETLIFGVKKNVENEEKLIKKTVTTGTDGVHNVELTPSDTADLPFAKYWYDVSVQSGSNFYNVIEASEFWIKKNVTEWGDAG